MFNPFRTKPADENTEELKSDTKLYNVCKTTYTIILKDGSKKSYVYTGYCYVSRLLSGNGNVVIRTSKDIFERFLKRSKNGFILFESQDNKQIFVPICNVDSVSAVTEEFFDSPRKLSD